MSAACTLLLRLLAPSSPSLRRPRARPHRRPATGSQPSMRRGLAWPAPSWSTGPPSAGALSGNAWQP